MKPKKKTFRWPLLAAALVLLGMAIGSTAAKYIHRQEMTGKVSFTARLADDIRLLERKAEPAESGPSNYTLTGETVESNTYSLMPGVDVPKDPYVRITGKTPIPAWLYVEVVDNTNNAISYTVDENWTLLPDITGKHGGKVYSYSEKLTQTGDLTFYILDGGEDALITVSDTYLSLGAEEEVLTFYAYLYEAIDDKDSLAVYKENNP